MKPVSRKERRAGYLIQERGWVYPFGFGVKAIDMFAHTPAAVERAVNNDPQHVDFK